ncbi:helix-turn-helix domain containing protein [Tistrella mobilis]|uniref:TetR/AcrR family transcriptional regulator n=1 Tax=Tistrella mobilis TaxID=171437 RepID=UPI00355759FB
MVRTPRFAAEDFVEAAIGLVAEGGPSAATMTSIARAVGAPTGSLYHRFDSRAAVMGAMWAALLDELAGILAPPLAAGRPAQAALALADWAAARPRPARALLLADLDTVLDAPPEGDTAAAIDAAEARIEAAFDACAARLGIAAEDAGARNRLRFLVIDAPVAALRPALKAGRMPGPGERRLIEELATLLPTAPGIEEDAA